MSGNAVVPIASFDSSIYKYQGRNLANDLSFQADFSYRSARTVLEYLKLPKSPLVRNKLLKLQRSGLNRV